MFRSSTLRPEYKSPDELSALNFCTLSRTNVHGRNLGDKWLLLVEHPQIHSANLSFVVSEFSIDRWKFTVFEYFEFE